MRWIASKTTIALFDYLILATLKSKLRQRQAMRQLFPTAKQKGRIEGIIFLILIVALLFIPLMIMSSKDSVGQRNSPQLFDCHLGVSGLATFYENQIAVPGQGLTEDQKKNISELRNKDLTLFATGASDQIRVIDLPMTSMVQWSISQDSRMANLASLTNGTGTYFPYGILSMTFSAATTKNRALRIEIPVRGDDLTVEQRRNLSSALNHTNVSVIFWNILPIYIKVPYDGTANAVANQNYNVQFRYTDISGSGSWEMSTWPNQTRQMKFMGGPNLTSILVWSEKTPDAITGSLLTSTGGLLGLYSFILLTIGQWVASWLAGMFLELWLSRMVNPQKLLKILGALEAYEASGELDKEFQLSELLLENLRTTVRVVQMTNVKQEGDQ
jgi:hypothetical protein